MRFTLLFFILISIMVQSRQALPFFDEKSLSDHNHYENMIVVIPKPEHHGKHHTVSCFQDIEEEEEEKENHDAEDIMMLLLEDEHQYYYFDSSRQDVDKKHHRGFLDILNILKDTFYSFWGQSTVKSTRIEENDERFELYFDV